MVNENSSNTNSDNKHAFEHASLHDVHDSMLDGLAQLASYFGFSKVMGQLFGTLLLNNGPLSLDEIMERLEISKASVSMNMRTLEHMGMVRQVWVRGGGGRRKYYEAETNFWQIITNLFAGRELRDIERAITVMDDNRLQLEKDLPNMEPDEQELAQLYIERMAQLQSLFRLAQMLMNTVLAQTNIDELTEITKIEIQ